MATGGGGPVQLSSTLPGTIDDSKLGPTKDAGQFFKYYSQTGYGTNDFNDPVLVAEREALKGVRPGTLAIPVQKTIPEQLQALVPSAMTRVRTAGASGGPGTDIQRAYAQYVEGEKAAGPINPFLVKAINAQQITGNPLLGQQSQFAPNQVKLAQMLMDRAQGQGGPSPAELMLQQRQDQIRNMALAQAASVGGRAMGAVQRGVGQQQALGAQEAVRNAAILRAQEQQQAVGDLSKVLEAGRSGELTQRGQDITTLTADQRANLDAQTTAATLDLNAQTKRGELEETRKGRISTDVRAGLTDQTARDLSDAEIASKLIIEQEKVNTAKAVADKEAEAALRGALYHGVGGGFTKWLLS